MWKPVCKAMLRSVLVTASLAIKERQSFLPLSLFCAKVTGMKSSDPGSLFGGFFTPMSHSKHQKAVFPSFVPDPVSFLLISVPTQPDS